MKNNSIPQSGKRAVLYARTSGEDGENATSSIKGQLDLCREHAQKKGLAVIAEITDDGISGASWDAPGLNEVLEKARAGAFDVLVVRELDRLARNLAKQLVIESEFSACGVELTYALGDYAATPEGALMKNVKAVIAEYERIKITERLTRGKRQKVKAGGLLLNRLPAYGYRRADAEGTALVIDNAEAEVVRLIFELYTGEESLGLRAVAQRLSDLKIPTPTDAGRGQGGALTRRIRPFANWAPVSVSGIIANETYAGRWIYGRNTDTPLVAEVPAIVSQATFARAQERRQINRNESRRNVKHDYLLRRRLTCGSCGSAMTAVVTRSKGNTFFYYRCNYANDTGHAWVCSQKKRFRALAVDAMVWDWVKSYLTDPAKLAQGMAIYQSERGQEMAPLRDRLVVVDKLIATNQGQLDRLLDLYLAGDFPKEALLERKTRLADTIAALERERLGLAAQLSEQTISEEDVQSMFNFAADVAQGIKKADQDFEARRRIIEVLDVRLTCAVEEGQLVIYPRCHFSSGERLSFASMSISRRGHNQQPFWVLSARLPLCNLL